MDKDFAARIIASKSVIDQEGSYRVRVSSTCNYRRLRSGGAQQIGIVNFRAMSIQQDKISKQLYAQGQYQEACNINLSLSILEGQYFPFGGQYVIIEVEEKTTSNGVTGLFVTECSLAPVEKPRKRSLAEWIDEVEGDKVTFPSVLNEEDKVEEYENSRI